MPKDKGGKPDAWSEELWNAYKQFGDWDHVYVESCNRFLKAIVRLYPDPISELIHELGGHGTEDELAIYRAWYAKHIKWPSECFCEVSETKVIPSISIHENFDDDTGELVAPTQVRPWFLGASIQLGRRLAEGHVPEPRQGLLSEPKSYDTQEIILRYLTESGWAVDQLWLEEAPDTWLAGNTRRPDQSIKDFINGLFRWLNIFMVYQIAEKGITRPHHRKELKGRAPDPEKKHEEILVRKMFGESISEIVVAMQDVLPKSDPRRAVSERVKLIAEYLGLTPPAGDKT